MPSSQTALSTRQRILAHLAEHHNASARSLSRDWGLTRADIRYHLNRLLEDGLIQPVERAVGGASRPGRPEQFFRLASRGAPHNLSALSSAMLQAVGDLAPQQEEMALRVIAGYMPGSPEVNSPLLQRLNAAVARLNAMGYHARWEAGPTGPRVALRACPYAQVVGDHPQVCSIDRYYLERLTGLSLIHSARLNLITGKPAACIFSARTGVHGN